VPGVDPGSGSFDEAGVGVAEDEEGEVEVEVEVGEGEDELLPPVIVNSGLAFPESPIRTTM